MTVYIWAWCHVSSPSLLFFTITHPTLVLSKWVKIIDELLRFSFRYIKFKTIQTPSKVKIYLFHCHAPETDPTTRKIQIYHSSSSKCQPRRNSIPWKLRSLGWFWTNGAPACLPAKEATNSQVTRPVVELPDLTNQQIPNLFDRLCKTTIQRKIYGTVGS